MKISTFGAAILSAGLLFTPALADDHEGGDPEKGKKVFKKCAACHAIGEGAKLKVGPPLNAIFGRVAGSYEGMKYGKHLVEAGEAGLVWTPEEMFAYLENPKKYLRSRLDNKKAKSKMAFKLKKKKDRRNLIAFLATLGVTE